MILISTKTKLTGPHTPSSETDEWYKLNTMFRAVVYQEQYSVEGHSFLLICQPPPLFVC